MAQIRSSLLNMRLHCGSQKRNLSIGTLLLTVGFMKTEDFELILFLPLKHYISIIHSFILYKEPEEGVSAPAAVAGPVTKMTQAQLEQLDTLLVDKSYITGYTVSQDDVYEFSRVGSVPAGLVNLARWHRHIASFSAEFSTIPGQKRAPPQGQVCVQYSS